MDQLNILFSYLFLSQECLECSLSQPKCVRITHFSLIAKQPVKLVFSRPFNVLLVCVHVKIFLNKKHRNTVMTHFLSLHLLLKEIDRINGALLITQHLLLLWGVPFCLLLRPVFKFVPPLTPPTQIFCSPIDSLFLTGQRNSRNTWNV